jgi:hypothetical protein
MRLWSIHPAYLDSRGLVALWREGLLAQKVLAGKTRGYRHHPQLNRFRESRDPLGSIGFFLSEVVHEADRRDFRFDASRILRLPKKPSRMPVGRGQLAHEFQHLLGKLKVRDPSLYRKWKPARRIRPHPAFRPVPGGIAPWEKAP